MNDETMKGDVKMDATRPWGSDPIASLSGAFQEWKEWLDDYLGDMEWGYEIDEIALLFPHPTAVRDFVFDAVTTSNVELFNVAWDRVHTEPFGTRYNVEYAFLATNLGMRIECMSILDGFSPLHEAMLHCNRYRYQMPIPVHASFKVGSMEEYAAVLKALREEGTMVQACDSTYGMFSYFSSPSYPGGVYLKPRFNKRDSEQIEDNDAGLLPGLTVVKN